MNKKAQAGIIIKIILGIIIALVIFIPACKVVDNVLRLSGQGLTSFNKLADNIQEVNAGNSGDSVATAVFLDKDTAIIGFEKNVESVKLFGIPYLRPGVCPKEKSCLVLCRHMEPTAKERRCRDIKSDEFRIYQFELKGFYEQGKCTNGCEGGFLIARKELVAEKPRERVVYADKGDGFVALCENRDSEKGCVGLAAEQSAPAPPPASPAQPAPDKVYKKMPPRDKSAPTEIKPDAGLCNKENEGLTVCGDSDGQSLYLCKRKLDGFSYKYEWEKYSSGPYNSPIHNCRTDADYMECKMRKVSYADKLYAECKLKKDDACYNDVWYADAPSEYVVWGDKSKGICLLCEKGKWSYIDKRYCENAVVTPPD